MKLAWLSPFCTNSAIGRFSQAVTDELAKSVSVDLWVDSREDLLRTNLPVIEYNPEPPRHLWWPEHTYDFAICNFGDYLPYHRRIFEFSRKVPSVAILHDYVMHHFFAGYYQVVLNDLSAHLRRVENLYGAPAREANDRALHGEGQWIWDTDEVVNFPMFEDCLSGAMAAVSHSRFLRDRAETVFPGPVEHIPLAYPVDLNRRVVQLGQFGLPPGKLLLLTVGNVNRNKRVDEAIACLAADRDLAARVFYLVCGHVEPSARERLERLIRSTGLADTVRLTGRVGAAELHSLMKAADICINLRNPAMEGGSASLVELMLYGKAGVVSDTGVYADMPDDCILKVRPEREAEDLADALSRLVSDAALRKRLGLRAREHAESNFTPSAYAGRLLAFLDDVGSLKPVFLPAYRASRILSDMNIPPDMPIVRTVAEMCAEMFCRPADEAPFNRK